MSAPGTPAASAPATTRAGRTRRRNVKAIDYSKVQEFSDDAFEDGQSDRAPSPSPTPAPTAGRRGRPRGSGRRKNQQVDEESSSLDFHGAVGYHGGTGVRYVEKGYDPMLPPIRERYTFSPEFEPDGSPKIDAIIGRRPIEEKEADKSEADGSDEEETMDEETHDDSDEESDSSPKKKRSRKMKSPTGKSKGSDSPNKSPHSRSVLPKHVDYEYLVKYKGRSYLHLDWKTASDLESMNKSAKTLYRRFLKKLEAGTDENLEDPNFDPSFAEPGRILDEKEEEVFVELGDKELLEWMKEREKELAEEAEAMEEEGEETEAGGDEKKPIGDEDEAKGNERDVEGGDGEENAEMSSRKEDSEKHETESAALSQGEEEKKSVDGEDVAASESNDVLSGMVDIEKIRKVIFKDGPYYPVFEGSDNPYRDGYVTEPPKKARASYLFFQGAHRSEYQKRYKGATQGEIMTILGDTWRAMSEEEQAPYIQLAREETEQYEKERIMLEKAQKPNELWQPMRRCRMVLDRISSDGFSNIFQEPVNTEDFPDYEEIVDQPMDLGTVRTKLEKRKYQAPEIFARDMRKIWNNCKIYNQHGSAIWHVADYMSKVFERLYHAWVLAFRNRYLRWANPQARPWELSCRAHDGKCGISDEKMVVCDHCDAMYGMGCLKPPLSQLPSGIWHCPDCCSVVAHHDRVRMLSALTEQAARKRAELGDVPKKRVKRKMYLVKWAGLGYEHCSWEAQDDINDDAIVAEYRELNNVSPEEPNLSQVDVDKVLATDDHVTVEKAKGPACMPELRVQLYAQTRALHFARFGLAVPHRLSSFCGPKSGAFSVTRYERETSPADEPIKTLSATTDLLVPREGDHHISHPVEVAECLADLVCMVSRGDAGRGPGISTLPPLLTGEYDAVIPITSKGLMMNVGEVHGCVAFLGYRQFPDGSKGPSELNNLVRGVGDKIIAVDGVSTVNKTFKEVIGMLRESGKYKFAYMRFLDNKFNMCDSNLTSMGKTGSFLFSDLSVKFKENRRLVLGKRGDEEGDGTGEERKEEESDESVGTHDSDDDHSSTSSSDAEFEPVGVDDLVRKGEVALPSPQDEGKLANGIKPDETMQNGDAKVAGAGTANVGANGGTSHDASSVAPNEVTSEVKDSTGSSKAVSPTAAGSQTASSSDKDTSLCVNKKESTKSLALRLLDGLDVGYSSDEGGDEDRAYFLDGVDASFSTNRQIKSEIDDSSSSDGEEASNDPEASGRRKGGDEEESGPTFEDLPVKKNEFTTLGERSVLYAAANVTKKEPNPDDFDNYPMPSSAAIAAMEALRAKKKEEEENAQRDEESSDLDVATQPSKKSSTKVEQISPSTNEVIRVWKTAGDAAGTLQISLKDIQQILKGDYNEEIGDEAGGFRWRYADADAEVTANISSKGSGQKGKLALLEFRDKLYDHDDPHVYKGGHKLRDYQIDGVNWLASCWYKKHCCILADEMGLGKTVQIVSYIEHLHRVEKILKPYLVVVPLSTVEHWRREFEGWTDMRCCVYHDRQREWRDVMREYEWYYPDRPHNSEFLKFDVLVTTYDTLIADFDVIGSIPWRVAVVDEAHRLRNVKGKLLDCMKQISQKGTLHYGFQSRVLMTGTPLQNNTQELWTLLNFIEPYKFPSLEEFQMNFGNMANREQVEALQNKISPYMLRRVKEDVAKDIPAKEETLIDVELTSIQKQYYRAIFEHNHTFLSMGTTRATAPKLMNIQMELRKCCNHPFLLDGVEQRELEKQHKDFLDSGELSEMSPDDQNRRCHEEGYIKTSGKMVLLDKLLPKLRNEGHKVLIFSQMVRMLDLISEYCDFRGFRHERLDGRVRGNERQKSIDRFETEEDSFLFLLSTRAGGVGINLTAADICIIFDSDWNPQNDVQAQARCHRIGQTKDVMIYRLVTSRTFEQEMFDRASKKLGLEQAVLGTFGQDGDDIKPTSHEMEQLLKKGAYALIEDENDDMGRDFCEDDIDNILAKRTRTRVVEGAKTSSWLNKQGLVVSKSKFTAQGAEKSAGVDLDDPLFWQKVMPDFVTPTIMLDKLEELSDLIGKKTVVKSAGANAVVEGRSARKKKPSVKKIDADGKDDGNNAGNESVVARNSLVLSAGGLALTRGEQKKVNKFMADLTGLMQEMFDQDEDDSLPQSEKTTCQKLLLGVSLKHHLFSEEQRNKAKLMLRRLEGDRRRRCRTSEQGTKRFGSRKAKEEEPRTPVAIPEELLIQSKRKKRRGRGKGAEKEEKEAEDEETDKKDSSAGGYVGEDGYLHHSDSEADWSDVGEDPYELNRKRTGISKKEAKRRRAWATDKDAATAAGRPWPALPRSKLTNVLETMLGEVIKIDQSKGGLFSVPVPKDDFPEYYELVKEPMDYGTMKGKLAGGEYRSAQAMQKDFVLIMQNCITFNAPDSDIVQEARRQALSMPNLLREAAATHHLFLSEDGSVLEVFSDNEESSGKKKGKSKSKGKAKDKKTKKKTPSLPMRNKKSGKSSSKRKRSPSPSLNVSSDDDTVTQDSDSAAEGMKTPDRAKADDASGFVSDLESVEPIAKSTRKPRIRISLHPSTAKKEKEASEKKSKKKKKRSRKDSDGDDGDQTSPTTPTKNRKKAKKSKKASKGAEEADEGNGSRSKKKKVAAEAKPTDHTDEEAGPEEGAEVEAEAEKLKKESVSEFSIPRKRSAPDTSSDKASVHLDRSAIKKEASSLDGSFQAARNFLVARGAWALPAAAENKYKDVATQTLNTMCRHDRYSLFEKPVTDDEAPGYSESVKSPMDFGTMRSKIDNGEYGTGSQAIEELYNDFVLVMDNCALYNDDEGEVVEEAARMMALLPEAFASACIAVSGGSEGKKKKKKRRR